MKETKNELVDWIVKRLDEEKGEDILVLELGREAFCDYMVIATGLSLPHLRGLRRALSAERKPRCAGTEDSGWVVLDFGEAIVHLFVQEARDFYDLESLWGKKKA